jgi:hypothetical protein
MEKAKEFTKDDLKTGHLVVLRNRQEYVVFRGSESVYQTSNYHSEAVLVSLNQEVYWLDLEKYLSCLKFNKYTRGYEDVTEHDIMEVYLQAHPYNFVREYDKDKNILLWKRQEKSEKDLQIEELEATINQAKEQISKLKGE